MKKAERAAQARRLLDEKLRLGMIDALVQPPARGWIRAIRDALGMTSRQLAERMGVSQAAIAKLERSELDGTIRLASLRRAAAAMDCTLIYGIVPRSSLEEIVRARARELAAHDHEAINQSMRLEDQAVTNEQLTDRIEEYASRLIAGGRLWDEAARSATR